MNVLLDECIPRKLKPLLVGHACRTVSEAGYAGKKNGELLQLAERAAFDVFLTLDRGIIHQQNLAARKISLVLLRTPSSRLAHIKPFVRALLDLFSKIAPGSVHKIGN